VDDQQLGAMGANVETLGREMGSVKADMKEVKDAMAAARGTLRTFLVIFGLIQAFATPAVIWLFTSMLQVRENNAVTDYRVKEIEARIATR
jgi:hypothetical protein